MKELLYPVTIILNSISLIVVLVMFGQADMRELSNRPEGLVIWIVAIAAPASALVYAFRQPRK